MRIPAYLFAGAAIAAMGLSSAHAAMLLHNDPQTGQKVIVDTEDPNYREEVIEGTGGTQPPADFPEGAWLLTEDESGNKMVVNPSTDHRYYLGEPQGTGAAQGVPEGAMLLETDPYSDEKGGR